MVQTLARNKRLVTLDLSKPEGVALFLKQTQTKTPGRIDSTGGRHGADTGGVLTELGVGSQELERLRRGGVV